MGIGLRYSCSTSDNGTVFHAHMAQPVTHGNEYGNLLMHLHRSTKGRKGVRKFCLRASFVCAQALLEPNLAHSKEHVVFGGEKTSNDPD
jgi:hypothetical protein